MHNQFCIKFPNHHFCICVMEIMWGIPFILEPNQVLTCIMSSHSTSFEPKSWLTINLDPRWECQSLSSEAKKEGEGKFPIKEQEKENFQSKEKKEAKKFPIKEWEKEKKKRKEIPNQRMGESKKEESSRSKKLEEICREVFGPDNIWTIQNCHQMNKKEGKGTTT